MTITAKTIADSISPQGIRITTMQLRYPRFIHAEFMTHRVFSRNASSSRAVPVERLITDIQRELAKPIHWGKKQAGMQANNEMDPLDRLEAHACWNLAAMRAIEQARNMYKLGAHKQIVNRLLEPFSHINVLVTSTQWKNFYGLRRHPDAQPEIKALADAMWDTQQASTPKLLHPGEWHLPYVNQVHGKPDMEGVRDYISKHDIRVTPEVLLLRVSVARCARVSYLTHDGKQTTVEEDLKLYERLVGSVPLHASPAEHQATPDERRIGCEGPYGEWRVEHWAHPHRHGNFTGWIQYRKTLAGECIN